MLRLNLTTNKSIDLLPDFLINKELKFNNDNEGSLTYSSFDIYRNQNELKLDIIEYQNHRPVKLGEIIVNLK